MTFENMLERAVAMLQRHGRVTYRALQAQFQLNDDLLDVLKEELLFAYPVADAEGRGLVWTGAPNPSNSNPRHGTAAEGRFHALLPAVTAFLQREKYVPYQTLKYVFAIDDALLDELRKELFLRRVAIDQEGQVLAWTGDVPLPAQHAVIPISAPGIPDTAGVDTSPVPPARVPSITDTPHGEPIATPEPSRTVPEAERRQLTVMFCDLADSTRLSQQLDPEDLREVMRAYQATAAEVVERFDGTIAQHLGDGLLIYFGWPQAHEDDAQRALHAGLGIVEAITTALNPRLAQDRGVQLTVRIGIHTGPVVVGEMGSGGRHENLATGETVNIAARLEGLAQPNTVVVSNTTARLMRDAFALDDLGPQVLKGVAEPMAVFRVRSPLDSEHDTDESLVDGSVFLVGRDEEVGLLLRRWAQSTEGLGQVVLISGEAGIGKSSLLSTVRHHVVQAGYARMTFRCSPYHANSALYPVIAHVQRVLQFQPGDTPATRLDKLERVLGSYSRPREEVVPLYADLLSVPLPEGRYAALHLTPQQQRQQTQDALVGWLLEEAERQPTLAMWEDLQWADPSTLELLGLVLEQTPTVPMLHVLTYRPEFTPPWPSRSHMTPLTLNRLERPQVEALITHLSGGKALPDEVVAHVVAKTDGVPLYVEELTRMLLASELLREETDNYTLTGPLVTVAIPDTLQDSLMARLDQLNAAKEVAQVGAVLGREFAYEFIQAVSSQDAATLQAGLAQLVEAELLYQRGRPPRARYIFKHALVQDAAYASLLRRTRQQVHQRIARVLEEQFPETVQTQPELVAHHYAAAGCSEQAIDYWRLAGQQAIAQVAYVEAVAYLNRALELLQTLPENQTAQESCMTILLQQERLYETLGQREHQQATIDQLFMRLQPTGESARLAEVYVRQGDLYTQMGRFDEAEHALDEALALRRAQSDAIGEAHVLRSMGFLRWHQGRYEEAVTCNEAALAIDRQRDDPTTMATDLTNLGAVLRNIGEHERALACLEEALHLHETAQNPVKQAFSLHSIANVHRELGATASAMTAYQQAYDIFTQYHDLVMASRSLTGMAHLHWEQGETDDSLRLYEDALRITRDSHHGHSLAHTLRTLGDRLLTLNEPEKALPYFLESTDVFAELGDAEREAESWEKLAAIYEQTLADDQEAFAAWEKARALRNQVPDCRGVLEALQHMGRLARHRLGKPTQASHYFRQALDLAMALGDHAKQGEFLNTLGIMAWQQEAYADALGHYEQALRMYGEIADAAHAGLILNSIGATLHRLERYDEALVRLQEAVAVNRQANQRLLEGYGLAVMGDVYRALDRYEQALDHYQASLNIRREIGDRKGEGWMLYALASVYAAQDAPAKAHDCVLEALSIAQECNDAELRRVCTSWQDRS